MTNFFDVSSRIHLDRTRPIRLIDRRPSGHVFRKNEDRPMRVILIPNRNGTGKPDMVDLVTRDAKGWRAVWATMHVDFLHDLDPALCRRACEGETIELEVHPVPADD